MGERRRSAGGNPPPILDPFAGGGSIPLEAQRLGLEAHASDLNPVAVLWAGRPPVHPDDGILRTRVWKGAQGLADDVRYDGNWMRDEAERRIGHLYRRHPPRRPQGHGDRLAVGPHPRRPCTLPPRRTSATPSTRCVSGRAPTPRCWHRRPRCPAARWGSCSSRATATAPTWRLAAEVAHCPALLSDIHLAPAGGTSKIVVQAIVARAAAAPRKVAVLLDNDEPGRTACKKLGEFGFQNASQLLSPADLLPKPDGGPFPYEAEDLFLPELIQAFVDEHGPSVTKGSLKYSVLQEADGLGARTLVDRGVTAEVARADVVRLLVGG